MNLLCTKSWAFFSTSSFSGTGGRLAGSCPCNSDKALRDFPKAARQNAGRQLERVQRGQSPVDFKPMPEIGKGVEEIRIREDSGAFRVIYTARLPDAVYVIHAFQKKTQTISRRDIEIARLRFSKLMRGIQ
jgi:phage-related protein